jgi:hypothetical protein
MVNSVLKRATRVSVALILLLITSPVTQAQESNNWHALADVSFQVKQVEGYEVEFPRFGSRVKNLSGKKISLKGYLIPLSEAGGKSNYMFSSLPFSSCFFCGAAGPETVVELQVKEKIKFTEKAVVAEGVLVVNDKDVNHHIYILKNATIIE